MIKNIIKKTMMGGAMLLALSSCRNEDLAPVPDMSEFERSIIPQVTFTSDNKIFDFTALSTSEVDINVDYNGFGSRDISKAEVYLSLVQVRPSVVTGEDSVSMKSVLLEVFNTLPASFTITPVSATQALGIDTADLEVGDQFSIEPLYFKGETQIANYSIDICNEAAYNGSCALAVSTTCPVSAPFVGSYEVVESDNLFGYFPTGFNAEITADGGNNRTIDLEMDLGGPYVVSFGMELLCDETIVFAGPTGGLIASCAMQPTMTGDYDRNDDTEFTITFFMGCLGSPNTMTLRKKSE